MMHDLSNIGWTRKKGKKSIFRRNSVGEAFPTRSWNRDLLAARAKEHGLLCGGDEEERSRWSSSQSSFEVSKATAIIRKLAPGEKGIKANFSEGDVPLHTEESPDIVGGSTDSKAPVGNLTSLNTIQQVSASSPPPPPRILARRGSEESRLLLEEFTRANLSQKTSTSDICKNGSLGGRSNEDFCSLDYSRCDEERNHDVSLPEKPAHPLPPILKTPNTKSNRRKVHRVTFIDCPRTRSWSYSDATSLDSMEKSSSNSDCSEDDDDVPCNPLDRRNKNGMSKEFSLPPLPTAQCHKGKSSNRRNDDEVICEVVHSFTPRRPSCDCALKFYLSWILCVQSFFHSWYLQHTWQLRMHLVWCSSFGPVGDAKLEYLDICVILHYVVQLESNTQNKKIVNIIFLE